jgi:hypothetical protein
MLLEPPFQMAVARFHIAVGVRRELRLMQVKQNSFSPSRILFTLGAGSDLS